MKKGERMYEYNGKTFPCDADTIQRLNYALALNMREERYVLAKKKKNKK